LQHTRLADLPNGGWKDERTGRAVFLRRPEAHTRATRAFEAPAQSQGYTAMDPSGARDRKKEGEVGRAGDFR